MDSPIDFKAALVVGRDDERLVRLSKVVSGDGLKPRLLVRELVNSALLFQQLNCTFDIATGDGFDGRFELGVLRANNLLKASRAHSGLLELLEGFTGVHGLMLPNVTNKQNAVVGAKALEELIHLDCAREA